MVLVPIGETSPLAPHRSDVIWYTPGMAMV